MALYSSNYLKSLTGSQARLLNERTQLFSNGVPETKTFDIFLSHSFLDKEEVLGIYLELTNLGFEVYVDWIIDSKLDRKNVTKSSAELIRKRMKSSKSLLLAMSDNAQLSKWIPWELGFIDGNTQRCALLPVSKESSVPKTFERSEYLLLYPYLKRAIVTGLTPQAFIVESAQRYVSLYNWGKNKSNPEYNSTNIDFL